MSKTIKNHPAVESCHRGVESGVDEYKYDVWLKDGWEFTHSTRAGCQGGHFHTVADFLHAQPKKKEVDTKAQA